MREKHSNSAKVINLTLDPKRKEPPVLRDWGTGYPGTRVPEIPGILAILRYRNPGTRCR